VTHSEHTDDEPTPVEITDVIDLHGFQPRDILDVVDAYLEAAVEKGFREVRLIHGRGKGVQRANVQRLLSKHPLVVRFSDAPPMRGGWGATIAWLVEPQAAPSLDQSRSPSNE
jgi:dsDNA-specific endonuclease/ATPase MutS2